MSVQLTSTDFCPYLPFLRVALSEQQMSVLEYVCFSSGSRSEVLASFVSCFDSSDVLVWLYCLLVLIVLVFLVLLCFRTRYAGIYFTCFTLYLLEFATLVHVLVFFTLTVCDHRISTCLGYEIRTDTVCTDTPG